MYIMGEKALNKYSVYLVKWYVHFAQFLWAAIIYNIYKLNPMD